MIALPREGGSIEGQVKVNASETKTVEGSSTTKVVESACSCSDTSGSSEPEKALKVELFVDKRADLYMQSSDAPAAISTVNVVSESQFVVSIPVTHDKKRPIVILGDTSGSMWGTIDKRLESLKISMTSLFNAAINTDTQIALMRFDVNAYAFKPRYLKAEDQNDVFNWINTELDPHGGTNVEKAIEDAIRVFPDALDIHVVCDGDVGSFSNLTESDSHWHKFCAKYKNIRFHFVALGDEADYNKMGRMSRIGGGNFTIANNNMSKVK